MANNYSRRDPEENFFISLPKIVYGLMKEIQRLNALKALELKFQIDDSYQATVEDVDRIMSTDPAGKYGRQDKAQLQSEQF